MSRSHGAIAQLGERVVRNDEVGSSILPGSTTIEAPTVLSWGFFSSVADSSRVFARVHADTCGLRWLPVWTVLGRFSLSPGHSSPGLRSPRMARSQQRHSSAPFQINGLRADGSSGWIAALPTRRGTAAARRLTGSRPGCHAGSLAASSSTFSIWGGELSKVAALAIKAAAIWPFRCAWRPASSAKASNHPQTPE